MRTERPLHKERRNHPRKESFSPLHAITNKFSRIAQKLIKPFPLFSFQKNNNTTIIMPGRTPDKDDQQNGQTRPPMSVLFEAMVKVGFRTFPLWRFSTRAVAKWVDSEGLHLPYPRTRTVQVCAFQHKSSSYQPHFSFFKQSKFNFTMPARRCEHEYDPARPPAGSAEEIEWELAYNRAELLAVDEAIQRDQRLLAAANMAIILWRWIRSRRAAALAN
ncbi:uncharacterized protein B0J16DRAFT_376528 [Fusarium flagelliforme]|uniref:uncharacterized protein n=1 Tax=Fusarium flagelliforme TaxID=2675880 RepID=UPI001E8E27DC|nr:uncharacterized protein B0J16DRAFT_376528 [Fusarium flagelliforme]KAH7173965.1 hypothetical protein B0J16DRAFT_376528 [Fusarium flagelliforme]